MSILPGAFLRAAEGHVWLLQYMEGSNVVVLDPAVADVFQDSESVNILIAAHLRRTLSAALTGATMELRILFTSRIFLTTGRGAFQ
jgi:hypothetical protein